MARFWLVLIFGAFLGMQSVVAADRYIPNTGDAEFDKLLLKINKKVKSRSRFIRRLSQVFHIPEHNIRNLYTHHDFNSADVLMTVSTADLSGEPLTTVAKVYFENKTAGWVKALDLLKIKVGSNVYNKIQNDINAFSKSR